MSEIYPEALPGSPPAQADATQPGASAYARAACEAFWRATGAGPAGEQPPDAAWEWATHAGVREAWAAAAQAVLNGAFPGLKRERNRLDADLAAARKALAQVQRENTELTAQLALDMDQWPKCPDGCGCRLGLGDADRQECGCDGPCTMECRENGYPDARSYRDLAVKDALYERDEARAELQEIHDALAVAWPGKELTEGAEALLRDLHDIAIRLNANPLIAAIDAHPGMGQRLTDQDVDTVMRVIASIEAARIEVPR